jgi:hypothetical protein
MRRFPYFAPSMLTAFALAAGCSSSSSAPVGDAGVDSSLKDASTADVAHPGHDATKPGHDASGGMDAKGKADTGVDAPPAASCTDGVMDGTETGVDCGGGQCPACGNGQTCLVPSDCASTVCSSGACVECTAPTDCAAQASLCLVNTCTATTCGTTNAATGTACTDNGGTVCSASGTCVACNVDADCAGGGVCSNNTCMAATCADGVKDGSETDVDCGGTACPPCVDTKHCAVNADCVNKLCFGTGPGTCVSCMDMIKDGNETGVDCGGTQCDALGQTCPAGGGCGTASDCTSPAACSGSTYTPPTACTGGLCVAGVSKPCAGPDGLCNAAVGCVQCNASTDCAAASCSGATFTPAATCVSNACVAGTQQACTGSAKVCNAADGCVQCNTVADCPAATFCSTPTCTANVCGTVFVPAGTALPNGSQTAGDCQKLVCNGNGSVTSVDDATNIPTSTSACETNPSCTGNPLAPSFTPAPTGTDCTTDSDPSAFVCGNTSNSNIAGTCVECNTDADCIEINDAGTLSCNTATGTCQ